MAPGNDSGAVIADRYLQHCEDRELDRAAELLAPGARIVFPGGQSYASLTEMADAQRGRYQWVRKHRERYFEGLSPDGARTVTSLGTLYGEDLSGQAFEGVRYVDVFVIRDGLIAEQHVYNDLTEAGICVPAGR